MVEIKNRKAYFDYFIEKEVECGIVLTGTEVKSIRRGSANIKDTYARIRNGEIFLINMYIAPYEEGNRFNVPERRERKLLLKKHEIVKLKNEVFKDGYSLIPLKLYFKGNYAKILLGLCKGKKLYDKRESIKERDAKLKIAQAMKNNI